MTENTGEEPGPSFSVSLSGGGYRAAAFSAGALLALAESPASSDVTSISSVSGGSIASALFLGAFANQDAAELANSPSNEDTEGPTQSLAYERAQLVGGLVTSTHIGVQDRLASAVMGVKVFGAFGLFAWFILGTLPISEQLVFVLIATLISFAWAYVLSTCAVQATIESIYSSIDTDIDAGTGADLSDLPNLGPNHVFCATDLSSGDHVYISKQGTLAPGEASIADAAISLSDAVAASAGFPGFRPIVISPAQLGKPKSVAGPRTIVSPLIRTVVGLIGAVLLGTCVGVFVGRVSGFFPGGSGLLLSSGVILVGLLLYCLCAYFLRNQPGYLKLVDGGICDNLGATFAFLSRDPRYQGLDRLLLGDHSEDDQPASQPVFLVVDASKPVEGSVGSSFVTALIPFRVRMLTRTAFQLVLNANNSARKRAIQHLLEVEPSVEGRVLSITGAPEPNVTGEDWDSTIASNQRVSTTLNALAGRDAEQLIRHGYRQMESALQWLGRAPTARDTEYFTGLVGKSASKSINQAAKHRPRGPYARRRLRTNLLFTTSIIGAAALYWWAGVLWG